MKRIGVKPKSTSLVRCELFWPYIICAKLATIGTCMNYWFWCDYIKSNNPSPVSTQSLRASLVELLLRLRHCTGTVAEPSEASSHRLLQLLSGEQLSRSPFPMPNSDIQCSTGRAQRSRSRLKPNQTRSNCHKTLHRCLLHALNFAFLLVEVGDSFMLVCISIPNM